MERRIRTRIDIASWGEDWWSGVSWRGPSMRRPVHTISQWKNPAEAAHLMIKNDLGRLPVVEDGQLIGIISQSDAMSHYYGLCPLDSHLDPFRFTN